jgi:uncharacterized protein (DUF433 family)/DNA-binding transcriptional MerR regulator
VAYPTHIAATLSGATLGQLAYWRRAHGDGPLLAPELGRDGGRVLYSFRDVVALRTFVYLRESLPLQRIRKAVHSLRELTADDRGVDRHGFSATHLSQYELYAAGDSVVWRRPDGFVDLVENPGSYRLQAVMEDVFGPFRNMQGADVVALFEPRPNVQVDPDTQGGYPVIKGTRIEFDLVSSLVRDGVRPAEIAEFYPAVTEAAALDAADFADLVDAYRSGSVPKAS